MFDRFNWLYKAKWGLGIARGMPKTIRTHCDEFWEHLTLPNIGNSIIIFQISTLSTRTGLKTLVRRVIPQFMLNQSMSCCLHLTTWSYPFVVKRVREASALAGLCTCKHSTQSQCWKIVLHSDRGEHNLPFRPGFPSGECSMYRKHFFLQIQTYPRKVRTMTFHWLDIFCDNVRRS